MPVLGLRWVVLQHKPLILVLVLRKLAVLMRHSDICWIAMVPCPVRSSLRLVIVMVSEVVVVRLIVVFFEEASLPGVPLWIGWVAGPVTILVLRTAVKGLTFLVPQDSLRLSITVAVKTKAIVKFAASFNLKISINGVGFRLGVFRSSLGSCLLSGLPCFIKAALESF